MPTKVGRRQGAEDSRNRRSPVLSFLATMPKPIIELDKVGKRYRIRAQRERYLHLRDEIAKTFRRLGTKAQGRVQDFWALRDVSFSVDEGEAVGIIGRNGAGKSTLLKILSRITPPTEGRITMRGRVASLLEVGTGFHPELSGRENIYLNGAILGMTRSEVKRKFDEIVAFSEVEEFLETPVKRYSSGMYVRLAFAVAAHLDPEVLIVDEVLAVGDAAFQKKCLGKMESVAKAGRTVLFVSHNMAAVNRLCQRAVVLDHGLVIIDAPAAEATTRYWGDVRSAPGDDVARLRAVRVLNSRGLVTDAVDIREPLSIEVEYQQLTSSRRPTAVVHIVNEGGTTLFATNDWENRTWYNTPRSPGLVRARCVIPGDFLAEGHFFVLAAVITYDHPYIHHVVERDVVSFQVFDRNEGDSVRGPATDFWPGVVRPRFKWEVARLSLVSSEPAVDRQKTAER
jgi:lipopolysaccharide transport system ATP-binding protein